MAFSPNPAGLAEMLSKMPHLSADEQRTELKTFADSGTTQLVRQKAAYVLGRLLLQSSATQDIKDAIARFQQASALAPLRERCEWHIVECGQRLGDEKLVRSTLEQIASKSSNKDSRASALYALAQSYVRTGERDKARETLSNILNIAPDSQFALGSTYYLAEIDLADAADAAKQTAGSGNNKLMNDTQTAPDHATVAMTPNTAAPTGRAIAAFKHYLQQSPDGRFAMDIASQLQRMPEFQATAADHNLLARVFYANGDYRDALDEWHKAGNTAAWYKQALAQIRLGKSTEGKSLLASGIKNHPSDEDVGDAATMLCRFLNKDGAIAVWKGVLQHSPKFADVASYNLATRAPSPAAALAYYQHVISSFPSSAYAPESSWWVAWNQIQAGKSQEALSTLETASARYPDAKAASRYLYWIGKLHERLGQKDQAKAAYLKAESKAPWHYYAHRAQARLSALGGGKDPGWSTNPRRHVHWVEDTADEWEFPEPPQQLAKQEGPTIEVLTELKQWDECLELLPEKTGLLRAFYLAKLNMPLEAINSAGKALHGTPGTSESWQLAYPLLHAQFIAHEAPQKQVDPFLVQALIREESRYNAQAISSSHALGLMQLMPGTALGVAKRLGVKITSNADIHNPQTNMKLGIDYLSYVLRRFNGNALFAVASYNGGPNAVQRWSTHMPPDTDVFVENIPFSETRDYVRKVFGSYWNYQQVYTPKTTAQR